MIVPVEISARHVHLSRKHLYSLFGDNYLLKVKRLLSQPGQFLSEEKVDLLVNGISINNISILGPERPETQVEISLTDARKLRLEVPVRESGNLDGSPGGILVGTSGRINLERGIIVSKRHIHMSPDDAISFGFKNGSECSLKIKSDRSLIFFNTLVRINKNYKTAAHIDTDEANACGISKLTYGELL